MAGLINLMSIVITTIGVFFGFFFLSKDPKASLAIVTSTSVGVAGTLAFIRHVIFHRSDAARLGWNTDRPDWIFEVGFSNLSFGFMGLTSVIMDWGTYAQVVVLLGYSLYLIQAAALHAYRYFTDQTPMPGRLWRSCLLTLLCAGLMCFFGIYALS